MVLARNDFENAQQLLNQRPDVHRCKTVGNTVSFRGEGMQRGALNNEAKSNDNDDSDHGAAQAGGSPGVVSTAD